MNHQCAKAACSRGHCGWILSGLDRMKVMAEFVQHVKDVHPERPLGTVVIHELDCDSGGALGDGAEDLNQFFESD